MLDRRRRVLRRRGERYANCAIVEHDRYGGGSLMVWGAYLSVPVQSCLCLTELWQANATSMKCYSRLFCLLFNNTTQCCRMTTQDLIGRVPAAEQCGSSRLACSIPWLVANRACLGHSRPACMTESSTTKNAPSFGRSLAEGVEEDTPATDCQTHQEYASSLCGLHRCNRWTYAILTDLWGFIGDLVIFHTNFLIHF